MAEQTASLPDLWAEAFLLQKVKQSCCNARGYPSFGQRLTEHVAQYAGKCQASFLKRRIRGRYLRSHFPGALLVVENEGLVQDFSIVVGRLLLGRILSCDLYRTYSSVVGVIIACSII